MLTSVERQLVIANKLNISAGLFSNIVNGKSKPSYEVLVKISKMFDVSIDDLILKDIELEGLQKTNPSQMETIEYTKYLEEKAAYLEKINLLQEELIVYQKVEVNQGDKKVS